MLLIDFLGSRRAGTFKEYFGKYGEIIDAVIMKDRHTQKPRGFGFITYSDPAIVDRVIEDNHVIDGKQVHCMVPITAGIISVHMGAHHFSLHFILHKSYVMKFKILDHATAKKKAVLSLMRFLFKNQKA